MRKDILRVIEYFQEFSYFPNFYQILQFLEKQTSEKNLKVILTKLIKQKILVKKADLYTLGEYKKKSQKSSHFAKASRDKKVRSQNQKEREENTKKKIKRINKFVKLLAKIPQIKLIGLSGSAAMSNTKEKDDLDLFIISSFNRIWTARLISLFLASIFNLRRRRFEADSSNKVCLNLFFDEKNMEVPDFKKNYFIAHEIIQMKPQVIKDNVYFMFLQSNKWVFNMFPNAKIIKKEDDEQDKFEIKQTLVGDFFENIFKKLQLWFINRHKTTEIISDSQLWFFPEDFEKKLPEWARKKYNK